MKAGSVYLVGAGPGDIGLITRKGLECLSRADIVIYDRLLDERLLDSAPAEAERIYAGKAVGAHTKSQSEINHLLVTKAKEGKMVVRLKGGDPFVLGRGGEEAESLSNEGIPFEVVPGVTSAVAVPAYAGIPVTHRSVASSFAVITGHEDPAKTDSSIDWKKLANGADTLIFLMGIKYLPEIATNLITNGRSPETPVAVIKEGTRPEQKTVTGSLKDITDRVEKEEMGPPAVIVVGEVVRLREKLHWFDNRPLFGKRILVTRARHQASTLSHLLYERGAQPVELPAIEILPTKTNREMETAILQIRRYQWLAFTSVNGVEEFFKLLHNLKMDARALTGLKVGAIGPATAKALETKGIVPDYVPEVYTGQGFVAGLKSHDAFGKCFLIPRADIADEELARGLREIGAEVKEVTAYRNAPATDTLSQAREMLLSGQIDAITFTSSSTVSNLVKVLGDNLKSINAAIICIGPKTAATAGKSGLKVDKVAGEHTILGLVEAIEEFFRKEE